MKRVAVCLSGIPGDLENSLLQIKKAFIDPLNADFFVWFWYAETPIHREYLPIQIYSKKNIRTTVYDTIQPIKYMETDYYSMHDKFVSFAALEQLKNLPIYMPYVPGYFSQWYAVKESNKLKKEHEKVNNFTYDIVFRVRTEIYYDKVITDNDLMYYDKKIIIPLGYGDGNSFAPELAPNSINDFTAFSSSSNMNIYTSLYDYIPQYCQETKIIHPESHLLYHIKKHNIPIHRIVFPGRIMKNGKFPFGPQWTPGVEYPGDKIAEELQ